MLIFNNLFNYTNFIDEQNSSYFKISLVKCRLQNKQDRPEEARPIFPPHY